MKLQTTVECGKSSAGISLGDRITVLGSCFADNIGKKLSECGFNVCVNPFGTLYNPVSICNSVARLSGGVPFAESDCVEMGAGAGLVCSFSHHTSFARRTAAEFIENANAVLGEASAFWKTCDKVIITLGTAWCFRHEATGETVSNCLKRPAAEFTRYRLGVQETALMLGRMVSRCPDKKFIFTVSPIRHLADGAHGNRISKSVLLLAVDRLCSDMAAAGGDRRCEYFPAYEILLDELRDYRFYAEDMCHPSPQAVDYIIERFMDYAVPVTELPQISSNLKAYRQSLHRPGPARQNNFHII